MTKSLAQFRDECVAYGRAARAEGRPITKCPFVKTCSAYRWWRKGWKEADAEIMTEAPSYEVLNSTKSFCGPKAAEASANPGSEAIPWHLGEPDLSRGPNAPKVVLPPLWLAEPATTRKQILDKSLPEVPDAQAPASTNQPAKAGSLALHDDQVQDAGDNSQAGSSSDCSKSSLREDSAQVLQAFPDATEPGKEGNA